MSLNTGRWTVVSLLFLGVLISYIDRGNLSIAAVPIMRELHLSPAAVGVTLSAFFWTYLVFQIPAGYLVDVCGLKWSYAIAFLIWSLTSSAICLVHTFSQLISLRLLLGMSEAIVGPASIAYIQRHFSESEQGLPTGIYLSGMMLGPAVGSFLGSILLERVGWRPLFLATGLVGCLWLWPWLHSMSSNNEGDSYLTTTNDSLASTERYGWVLLLLNPVTWGVTVCTLFYSYFWFFCLTWLPSYLVMSRHFSYSKMGGFMALPLVTMAMSSLAFGALADRLAKHTEPLSVRKWFVIVGFILGCSILLLTTVKSPGEVLSVLIFSFMAMGLASANFWAITELISPKAAIARLVSYQNTIATIGGAGAALITGILIGNTGDFRLAVSFAGASLLIAAGATFVFIRETGVNNFRHLLTTSCRVTM
jgi:ACS family D-galactonate transporter-like MFS transporter